MAASAHIAFTVEHQFVSGPRAVWDALIDWKAHGDWIPMTRVQVDPGDPTAVGATFTAWTGPGPLSLKDRMRVERCVWDQERMRGDCEVAKLGPVLRGTAGFTVEATDAGGAQLVWIEDVSIPHVPRFLAPLITRIGAAGFRSGMKRLAKQLDGR